MPDAPNLHEILREVAIRAVDGECNLLPAIASTYRTVGWSPPEAAQEAENRLTSVARGIDEHVRTFPGRRLREYYKRTSARRAGPVSGAGVFRWTPYVRDRLGQLQPREFEWLVGNLLAAGELHQVFVTRASNDAGIDFVGKKELEDQSRPDPEAVTGPSLFTDQRIFAFGQVKRYGLRHPVGAPDFTALTGAITMLKNGGGTQVMDWMLAELQGWGWHVADPIMLCFATSGVYADTIPGLARQQRISVLDGEQLAQRVLQLKMTASTRDEVDALISVLSKPQSSDVVVKLPTGVN